MTFDCVWEFWSMDKIIDRVRATPAVAWARAHCPWVVATAVYWTKVQHIAPPGTHTEVPMGCWLAFTNPGTAHGVGGWTHVAFSLEPEVPHDDKRTAHLVKILPPLVLERPCVCKPLLSSQHLWTLAPSCDSLYVCLAATLRQISTSR